MADWMTAYNFMMSNEDSQHVCARVPDSTPENCTGPCFAISGINSGIWPTQFNAIAALPQDQREPLVQQFYHDNYWNNWFAQINSDDVSMRVFDFSVNSSSHLAVKTLQQAVNSLLPDGAPQIAEDGGWGPMTLAAVNAADSDALTNAFKAQRLAHYQSMVAADPSKQQYIKDWTARAEK